MFVPRGLVVYVEVHNAKRSSFRHVHVVAWKAPGQRNLALQHHALHRDIYSVDESNSSSRSTFALRQRGLVDGTRLGARQQLRDSVNSASPEDDRCNDSRAGGWKDHSDCVKPNVGTGANAITSRRGCSIWLMCVEGRLGQQPNGHGSDLRSFFNLPPMVQIASFAALAAVASLFDVTSAVANIPSGNWPTPLGSVKYSAPFVVKAGTVFDGQMKTYERSNVPCKGQAEGGKDLSVFLVEPGATLKNVIIGANQREGVHCESHDCTIENVWWNDVCEDALTIKGGSASSVARVIGGGARNAEDKIIQHNGAGTVSIEGFYAQDFGKLYRSCGSCKTQVQRKVTLTNVYAVNPKVTLVGVNKNYNDQAKLTNVKVKTSKKADKQEVCTWFTAVTKGEPTKLGNGPSPPLCQYSTSDVQVTA
ncbi:hypothetical protein AC1031_004391 [Aphanomyces cochlioides]|nr:hypothetical protein AC1031_004391 [Aphanomyces cochlioides]